MCDLILRALCVSAEQRLKHSKARRERLLVMSRALEQSHLLNICSETAQAITLVLIMLALIRHGPHPSPHYCRLSPCDPGTASTELVAAGICELVTGVNRLWSGKVVCDLIVVIIIIFFSLNLPETKRVKK